MEQSNIKINSDNQTNRKGEKLKKNWVYEKLSTIYFLLKSFEINRSLSDRNI